jgi:hypothetical protein
MAAQPLAKTLHPQITLRANLQDLAPFWAAFEPPHPPPSSPLKTWLKPVITHALGALLAAAITSALFTMGFILKAEGAANASPPPSHQCEALPAPVQQPMPHKKPHRS